MEINVMKMNLEQEFKDLLAKFKDDVKTGKYNGQLTEKEMKGLFSNKFSEIRPNFPVYFNKVVKPAYDNDYVTAYNNLKKLMTSMKKNKFVWTFNDGNDEAECFKYLIKHTKKVLFSLNEGYFDYVQWSFPTLDMESDNVYIVEDVESNNGFKKKYSYSVRFTFDDLTDMPGTLRRRLDSQDGISSVDLAYRLANDYGYRF